MAPALSKPDTGKVTHQANAIFRTTLHCTADLARYHPIDTTAPTYKTKGYLKNMFSLNSMQKKQTTLSLRFVSLY